MKLSDQLSEAVRKDKADVIDGYDVVFSSSANGDGSENWEYTVNGARVGRSHTSYFRAREAAVKDVAKIKKKDGTVRDRDGTYSHSNKWDRMCVCGHTLGDHTAVAIGGKRDCLKCEADPHSKMDPNHRFVHKKT